MSHVGRAAWPVFGREAVALVTKPVSGTDCASTVTDPVFSGLVMDVVSLVTASVRSARDVVLFPTSSDGVRDDRVFDCAGPAVTWQNSGASLESLFGTALE